MIIIRWVTFRISIIFLFPWIVDTFNHNLMVRKEDVFKSSNGSYFGYSLVKYQQTDEKRAQWFVGAPGENTFQGAVYKCSVINATSTKPDCKNITSTVRNSSFGKPWFGATVVSRQGFAMFCSPRAGNFDPEGECYTSSDKLENFKKVTIPDPRNCLTGFSATYMSATKNGSPTYVLGGPTCLKNSYTEEKSKRDKSKRDPLRLLDEGDYPKLDKWYIGYAMTTGMYGKKPSEQPFEFLLISVAFHIRSSFAGMVYLLDKDTKKEIESLVGYQPGEHFGASLVVSDFTGDGLDDIVVGAPHYTDYSGTNIKVEIGAVYIYYQSLKSLKNKFQNQPKELRGQISNSRFGYAVAAIGDTDRDGFNDLAIGAPYENLNEKEALGTVYIYRGSRNGLQDNPQIIKGNMFSPPLRTFGFAIAGGDFDGNEYSDVVVGAYESAALAYIPARPIANIDSNLEFTPNRIDLNKTECSITNSTDEITVSCGEIKYCITYSGLSVENEMKLQISIVLDFNAEKGNHRILFYENNDQQLTRKIKFTKGSKMCMANKIYVKSGILNLEELTSIVQANMTIDLTEQIKTHNRLLPIFSKEYNNIISSNSLSFMNYKGQPSGPPTPWWIYLASGLGALLILAIITGVLYKLGFFKRKLPPIEQKDGQQLTEDDGL